MNQRTRPGWFSHHDLMPAVVGAGRDTIHQSFGNGAHEGTIRMIEVQTIGGLSQAPWIEQ
jgi:hypothetical protein